MAIQQYGNPNEPRLLNNQLYTISFELGGEKHLFTFTSRYSPMYSTVKIIRSDYPDLFAELSDDTINFQIWQTSQLVEDMLADDTTGQIDTSSLTPSMQFAMKQYVRFKTEYNIVRNILVALSTKGGMEEKHLAEFKITREVRAPYLNDVLKALQDELRKWEAALGGAPQPRGAVRAGQTAPFPLNGRVSF